MLSGKPRTTTSKFWANGNTLNYTFVMILQWIGHCNESKSPVIEICCNDDFYKLIFITFFLNGTVSCILMMYCLYLTSPKFYIFWKKSNNKPDTWREISFYFEKELEWDFKKMSIMFFTKKCVSWSFVKGKLITFISTSLGYKVFDLFITKKRAKLFLQERSA